MYWEKDGYILRPAVKEDADKYYEHNYNPLDGETARLTGCKPVFTRDEVVGFFNQCVDADDRYDFMIVAPDGNIAGESVVCEIDRDLRSAHFRIALFHSGECGRGIGSWALECTLGFAFEELKLHRLELEVYSFNPRALHIYEKAGFRREGTLRDAVKDGEQDSVK